MLGYTLDQAEALLAAHHRIEREHRSGISLAIAAALGNKKAAEQL